MTKFPQHLVFFRIDERGKKVSEKCPKGNGRSCGRIFGIFDHSRNHLHLSGQTVDGGKSILVFCHHCHDLAGNILVGVNDWSR
jgi:hypothetical protein